MQLKGALTEISGLRHMVDTLDVKSGLGRRVLLESPFLVNPADILSRLQPVGQMASAYGSSEHRHSLDKATIKLSQVRDIAGTIRNIHNRLTLNDIELFEVKSFALLANEIRGLTAPLEPLCGKLPGLEDVIATLDPENTRIPAFYISSAFAPELAELRKTLAGLELAIEEQEERNAQADSGALHRQAEELRGRITEIEDGVRQNLSARLQGFAPELGEALLAVANLDILIAKAKQSIAYGLIMPRLAADTTSYQGLFHPQLRELLAQEQKRYQPVDIELHNGTCLITGANMAGKTVLLKTLALSQALCQFGFLVPAQSAQIAPVGQILFSIADEQSELSGLSSYAAEMLKVNRIVQQARGGQPLLVLVDELARTTNPTEGRAIVSAVANLLNGCNVKAVITTHYSGLSTRCRKLRVRGFVEESRSAAITVRNIGDYIDYSLVDDDGASVPHEALRIAQILGVDAAIVSEASKLLDDGNKT